jgi:Uncharacterised nucleotidyltransferase
MKRAGFTGDIWPDETQELLLRSALLPGAPSVAAWSAVRPRIKIDYLPGELHRLIPLLSKTLAAQGADDRDLPRLKGVYQFNWYRNQRLLDDGAGLLGALEAAGVRTMLLRGAAMALVYYGDVGARPMNDLDVLLAADALGKGRRIAEAGGWSRVAEARPLEQREAATILRNQEGRVVRLHWSPSRNEPVPAGSDHPIWTRAIQVPFGNAATCVPSPADHLVYTCLDGARANSGSTLRWITDATVLLQSAPDLDWEVVVEQARRHRVSLLIAEALRYLVEVVDANVPSGPIEALMAAPTTTRDRVAHRLSLTTSPGLPSGAELVGRFTRLTADLPLPAAIGAMPAFLQAILGVPRRRDVPLAVARKAIRAVVSPARPLAELSKAGQPRSGGN